MESKKIKVYILFFSVILESRSFLETNDPALLKSFFTSVLPHDLQETSQELQVPSQDLTTRLKPAEALQDRSDASEETGENSSSSSEKKLKNAKKISGQVGAEVGSDVPHGARAACVYPQ